MSMFVLKLNRKLACPSYITFRLAWAYTVQICFLICNSSKLYYYLQQIQIAVHVESIYRLNSWVKAHCIQLDVFFINFCRNYEYQISCYRCIPKCRFICQNLRHGLIQMLPSSFKGYFFKTNQLTQADRLDQFDSSFLFVFRSKLVQA